VATSIAACSDAHGWQARKKRGTLEESHDRRTPQARLCVYAQGQNARNGHVQRMHLLKRKDANALLKSMASWNEFGGCQPLEGETTTRKTECIERRLPGNGSSALRRSGSAPRDGRGSGLLIGAHSARLTTYWGQRTQRAEGLPKSRDCTCWLQAREFCRKDSGSRNTGWRCEESSSSDGWCSCWDWQTMRPFSTSRHVSEMNP
jgi:hypothetical protein